MISICNNIEGKITECWLVNEESIFFLILLREEGKITLSRLVLRLPSNSLFNRAWRSLTRNIEELKDKSENEKKKNSTEWWMMGESLKETCKQI